LTNSTWRYAKLARELGFGDDDVHGLLSCEMKSEMKWIQAPVTGDIARKITHPPENSRKDPSFFPPLAPSAVARLKDQQSSFVAR